MSADSPPAAAAAAAPAAPAAPAVAQPPALKNLEDFPDLLTGSFTDGRKFSTGNTLPLVARPWGFNHWSLQTNGGQTSWWFGGSDHEFHWLRLTHQPSPWIGDWAFLCFGPQMGGRVDEPVMFFEPWGAKIKPYSVDATLGPDNMRVQLSPTDHGAVLKVTFPSNNPRGYEKRICFKLPPWNKRQSPGRFGAQSPGEMWLELVTTRAESVPSNFGLNVRAEVDVANLQHQRDVGTKITESAAGLRCFEFSPRETEVTVWIGTSFISTEQAKLNLEREVRGRRFEEVQEETRLIWRNLLSRVDLVDPGPMGPATFKRITIFYTNLYRALLFPRRLDEVDASGKRVHYSPYDPRGGTHEGILVTDTGFWDTFRTVYPLLTLVYPQELGEIVMGWLNAYKEGSWLPEWSSPGYRSCMVGTFADVVVADAVLKGIPGVDVDLAWQALYKDAYTAGGQKGQGGKSNYNDYNSLGYIPAQGSADSVSGTLDFAYSDFAASLVAEKLGKSGDADRLRRRAIGARQHLFDSSIGLMRPKMRDGQLKRSDPSQWGDGYVEGCAWHHSFPAYDLPGLASLHGSNRKLAEKIREVLTTPGTFSPGTYRTVIHEMEEMRALGMGQYAHSNQPVHHILWLLLMMDEASPECNSTSGSAVSSSSSEPFCPRRLAESTIGTVLDKAYGYGFYSGDEDNGEMGAWYVLAALGLFDAAPGTHQGYTLGSPLFRRVDIHRKPRDSGGPVDSLTILSPSAGVDEVTHVSRVLLNGVDVGPSPGKQAPVNWALPYERLSQAMPRAVLQFVGTPGLAAAPASELAPTPSDGERAAMQQRIQMLEQQLEQQRSAASAAANAAAAVAALSGSSAAPSSPALLAAAAAAGPSPATAAPESSIRTVSDALVEAQRVQIRQLEQQVKHQQQELKLKSESGMEMGLATTAQMAFFILVAVNLLGWVFCMFKGRKAQVAPAASSSGRSKRAGVPNGKKRGGDLA